MTSKNTASKKGKQRDKLSLAVPITLEESSLQDPSPNISGFGIHPGLFNGIVEVQEDELDNLQRTLKTAQLRADHGEECLDVIGKVNDAFKTFDSEAGKEGVKYYAEFDQDDEKAMKIFSKVKNGYINASSIGFSHDSICSICGEDFHECEHFWWDGAHVIAKNCEVFELSIVPLGADGDATAVASGLSKNNVKKFKAQFEDKKTRLKLKGGKIMEGKEKKESFEAGELVSQLAAAQAETIQKNNEITQLKQQLAQQKQDIEKLKNAEPDTTKDDEIDRLKNENEEFKNQLNVIHATTQKNEAEKLVLRQVAVGLITEDEKEAQIEKLSKASEETLGFLTESVEVLEKQKADRESALGKDQKGKIPKQQGGTDKLKQIDYDDEKVQQMMNQTVFNYKTVFADDGRKGIKGVSYMGL